VLSNNDGCVIARSKEAKAMGIKIIPPMLGVGLLCIFLTDGLSINPNFLA
jgi:nucleotidyltransferase/DNA polymerase involved in DNA repair